jgi:hypothetical protein
VRIHKAFFFAVMLPVYDVILGTCGRLSLTVCVLLAVRDDHETSQGFLLPASKGRGGGDTARAERFGNGRRYPACEGV